MPQPFQTKMHSSLAAKTAVRINQPIAWFLVIVCGVLVAGAVVAGWSTPVANHAPAVAAQDKKSFDPPGTIDGAKNPELIPDQVAFRLVILAIIGPEGTTDDQRATRARNMIGPLGLSDDDTATLIAAVTQYKKGTDSIESDAAKIHARTFLIRPGTSEWDKLVQLDKSRDQLIRDTVTSLESLLSADAISALHAYVRDQKRGIKIVPESNEMLQR